VNVGFYCGLVAVHKNVTETHDPHPAKTSNAIKQKPQKIPEQRHSICQVGHYAVKVSKETCVKTRKEGSSIVQALSLSRKKKANSSQLDSAPRKKGPEPKKATFPNNTEMS
jgi:hypothetical protein